MPIVMSLLCSVETRWNKDKLSAERLRPISEHFMLMTQKHTHKKMLAYELMLMLMLMLMNQVFVVRNVKKKNKHILFQFRFNCGEILEFLHSVTYVRFKTG